MAIEPHYVIKFTGAMYCNDLYNSKGGYIYEQDEAEQEAELQYPDEEYEVWKTAYEGV